MKVIFLDFDGPIIPSQSHRERRSAMEKAWPPCVAALNRITDCTRAKIVVSSSWRCGGLTEMKGLLKMWGVTGDVIACTPHHETPLDGTGQIIQGVVRGQEIQEWIDVAKDNGACLQSFVILDDDTDMDHLLEHLIETPFEVGLTESDADRAIAMLGASQ